MYKFWSQPPRPGRPIRPGRNGEQNLSTKPLPSTFRKCWVLKIVSKIFTIASLPAGRQIKNFNNFGTWARSSAVERFSDKEEVVGSTPTVPTNIVSKFSSGVFRGKGSPSHSTRRPVG